MNALTISPQSNRVRFADRINGHIRAGLDSWYAAALDLIEAKRGLPAGEFTAMLRSDLVIAPEMARHLMKMPFHPRVRDLANLAKVENSKLLPEMPKLPRSLDVMDALSAMQDEQYEAALAQGLVRENATLEEVRAFKRQYRSEHPKRPLAAKERDLVPVAPKHGLATTRGEIIYLCIAARHSEGISQESLDAEIGWADGFTSKWENPTHDNDGVTITLKSFLEYVAGISYGIRLERLTLP